MQKPPSRSGDVFRTVRSAAGVAVLAAVFVLVGCEPSQTAAFGEQARAKSPRNPRKPTIAALDGLTPTYPEPAATPTVPNSVEPDVGFFGEPDEARRQALATQPIAHIELGRGGRSVAFKLTLADGTVGYYKPEQTFSAAHWFSEVAAYYLDRELGLGRVAPVVGRSIPWEPLRQKALSHPRRHEVVVQPDGTVRGAFVWWIPERLVPLRLGRGWEHWLRVRGTVPISPFQRPTYFREQMAEYRRRQARAADPTRVAAPPPREGADLPVAEQPNLADRPAELSDIIVFDYLVSNVDRWGGDFTNLRTREPGGPLVYLDNAAGFWQRPRLGLMDERLRTIQRFRRSTIQAIRAFDRAAFERRLARDPLAPILTERQLEGLEQRRQAVLDHVAGLERQYGEAAIYFE